MLYVFDDAEEMQACCGCPIIPDSMRTYSVFNDQPGISASTTATYRWFDSL